MLVHKQTTLTNLNFTADLDVVSNYDHLAEKAKSDLSHQATNRDNFNNYFHCCSYFSNVKMCEVYQMFYIEDGVIMQPLHVNYHGIENSIEGGILADLEARGTQVDEVDWTFNLILLRYRVRPEDEQNLEFDTSAEVYVHNPYTRMEASHLACEFVPIEDYPWEIALERMRNIVQDEAFEMQKGDLKERLASNNKDKILPYLTTKKAQTADDKYTYYYCWGVNEGLQRASAVTGLLSKSKTHDVGQLKVNIRLFAVKKSDNMPPPSELLRSCSQFSKETALNNQIISKPNLCVDLISVIVSCNDVLMAMASHCSEYMITEVLVEEMEKYMKCDESFYREQFLG